jgi:hypothetical protein
MFSFTFYLFFLDCRSGLPSHILFTKDWTILCSEIRSGRCLGRPLRLYKYLYRLFCDNGSEMGVEDGLKGKEGGYWGHLKRGERFLEPLEENYTSYCFLKTNNPEVGQIILLLLVRSVPLFLRHYRIIIKPYILIDETGRVIGKSQRCDRNINHSERE